MHVTYLRGHRFIICLLLTGVYYHLYSSYAINEVMNNIVIIEKRFYGLTLYFRDEIRRVPCRIVSPQYNGGVNVNREPFRRREKPTVVAVSDKRASSRSSAPYSFYQHNFY